MDAVLGVVGGLILMVLIMALLKIIEKFFR